MKHSRLATDKLRERVSCLPVDALTAVRAAALGKLDAQGLPGTRHEDWKYTDLGVAIDISNRWLTSPVESTATTAAMSAVIDSITASVDANWLIIANGIVDLRYFEECSQIDIDRFGDVAVPAAADHPLAELNTALLRDGLRIHVVAATEKPLAVLVIDGSSDNPSVSQARVEIEIAAGCDAEIIEYHASVGTGDHYCNSLVTLQVGEAAIARYVRIQNRAESHVQTGRLSVSLGKDSQLNKMSVDLGGALIRNDVDISIGEPGVSATFNGLYLAGEGQHIDNHTRVDHRVGPAASYQEYRGILKDRCRAVWNGKAVVHKGADGTDANQANHNLLLSEHAEIDAKPELEIYADDVKCSHGTTVGQLDESALFYLRSRGLGKREATQILVHAFATDLVSRTPVTGARAAISTLVEDKLAALIQEEAL